MEKTLSYEDYCLAHNLESVSNLCWNLAGMLSEKFVGYEKELVVIQALAIEFDKKFVDLVGFPYEG